MKQNSVLYVLLISVLMLQFLIVPVAGTHLKPFMVVAPLIFLVLIFSRKFTCDIFKPYEQLWLFTYLLSAITIVYASNTGLAARMIVGQFVLVLLFLILRYYFVNNSLDKILAKVFYFFIIASITFYVIGCLQVFVFGNYSIFYQQLNEHSYRIWGCYFELDNFVRFMGVSESPNNFEYFAILIFWWAIWKQKTLLVFLTLVSTILTVSSTAIVVLSVQGIVFLLYRRKLKWYVFFIIPVLVYIAIYIYNNNEFVQSMLEVRMRRNETGSGRFALWEISWKYIMERPLFGYGINQFREIMSQTELASSHNNIIETLLSTGFVGGIVYIAFLYSFLRYSWKMSHFYKHPFFLIMCIGFVLFGMANNILAIEYVPFILALFYAYGKLPYLNNRISKILYRHDKSIYNSGKFSS